MSSPAVIRLLRPHQWTKNLLVFVPMVMAHEATNGAKLVQAALAFAAFSLAASTAYVVNDVSDAEHDRAHPDKRARPIASGEIRPSTALFIAVPLLAASLAIATSLGRQVLLGIGLYFAMSILYSTVIKRIAIADVVLLAGFYSLRLLVGGAATNTPVSQWLIAFSSFAFFSLALAKRHADLVRNAPLAGAATPGRGYVGDDRQVLLSMGTASAAVSILVFALYVSSEQMGRLYARTWPLWLICPLLMYGMSRLWLLAHRGALADDPIVTATKDPVTYAVGGLIAALLLAAAM